MSYSLQLHGLQPIRIPCPSLSPKVCSNSCPLSQWCYLTISSSIAPFSSFPQYFPPSGSFPELALHIRWPKYWCFSISHSNNIQGWFPLGLTLLSKGLWRVFSSTTVQKYQFFGTQPNNNGPALTSIHDFCKNHSFDYLDLCQQSDVSTF